MKGKRLLMNTILLTFTSLFLRVLGLVFQVFLSRRMGAAGIGLLQLVMSVEMFAATVAISGVRFTTTRLVSEESGRGKSSNVPKVVARCLAYAASFGLAASAGLFALSGGIADNIIGDGRMELPLRILSVSLPFLSTGAVFGGYFTGVCRVGKSAVASISEQVCRCAVSFMLMSQITDGDVESMCAAVALGNAIGEIFSFFVALILYLADRRRYSSRGIRAPGLTARVLKVAVPLAASAYTRTALSTVHNMMIPSGLRRSGASSQAALAGYGTIHGMVFPVITFPSVIFSSVSELIVPELTEEQVRGRYDRITNAANVLLKICLVFSVGVMGALMCFADELGEVLYNDGSLGRYIRMLAFLMPVMYMDTVTDGMLRGLGQQMYAMRVNIIDSILSTALIYFLLPKFAIYGYIFILYASEIFNFYLSMRRLRKTASVSQRPRDIFGTAAAVICCGNLTELAMRLSGGVTGAVGLASGIAAFTAMYVFFIMLFSVLSRGELKAVRSALR